MNGRKKYGEEWSRRGISLVTGDETAGKLTGSRKCGSTAQGRCKLAETRELDGGVTGKIWLHELRCTPKMRIPTPLACLKSLAHREPIVCGHQCIAHAVKRGDWTSLQASVQSHCAVRTELSKLGLTDSCAHHQTAINASAANSDQPVNGVPPQHAARSCAMLTVVKLSLSLLRIAVHASFFLEAQRLLLRLLQPAWCNHLQRAEAFVLAAVRTPLVHRYVADGLGNSIHVIEAGPASRRPTAVLLHGHSMSAAFWVRNFDDLVSLGFRVLAVDLLGWGRSPRPPFSGNTPHDAVVWYLSSLRGVFNSLNLSNFTLIGHSLGAYLAMEYTKAYPRSVDQLVLVSPAACTRKIAVSRALYFSLPPQRIVRRGGLLGFLLFFANYPKDEMYIKDRLRDYSYHLAAQHPPSGEVAVRPIIRMRGFRRAECVRPLIEHLSLFHVPVQIICGETDSSMSIESVHDLYREMHATGFNVRLTVVRGADHCPMLEKPDDFFQILSRMCKRQSICNESSAFGEQFR